MPTIAGKKINILAYRERIHFPELTPEILKGPKRWYFRKKKRQIAEFLRDILQTYRKRNLEEFYQIMRETTEQAVIQALEIHPEFITSDPLTVRLHYEVDENKEYLAEYMIQHSSKDLISLRINIHYTLNLILVSGVHELRKTIYHELSHHLDPIHQHRQHDYVLSLAKRKGGMYAKYYVLYSLYHFIRVEGLPEFNGQFKHNRQIPFSQDYFKKFYDALNLLSKEPKPEAAKELHKILTNYARDLASCMTAIIVLYHLFNNNARYSAWIRIKQWKIWTKDVNADQISKFLDKDFLLVFTGEAIEQQVRAIMEKLHKLNLAHFLKEYEDACKYLGIKEPYFTLKSYSDQIREIMSHRKV